MDAKLTLENGVLMIAASGMGSKLNIPSNWGNSDHTSSENCLFIDVRNTALEESNIQAHVKIIEFKDTQNNTIKLTSPNKKLYIGDIAKTNYIIFKHAGVSLIMSYKIEKKPVGVEVKIYISH